jgi:CheY-like chemotaxis protein
VVGASAAGVLLGGLGVDGAAGLLALRQTGAFTLCEDPKTAIFPDMTAAAASRGSAEIVAPVEEIAGWILRAATEKPLPAPPAPIWRSAAKALRTMRLPDIKAVVVDEDATTLDFMRGTLEELGFGSVRATSSIAAALTMVQEEDHHLLILPSALLRDGGEAIQQAVKDIASQDKLAIIVSASDQLLAAGNAAITLGAIGIVERTLEPAILRSRLERAMLRSLRENSTVVPFRLAG